MRCFFVFSLGTLLIQLMAVVTFTQQASQTQSTSAKGVEER